MEDKQQFAGFWKRFLAIWIDNIIVVLAAGIICVICFFAFSVATLMDDRVMRAVIGLIGYLVHFTANVLYHSLFESSKYQATPGKMGLGIVVTNATGGRIGLGRAIGRNVARILSEMFFCLGYIIAGFTDRRQGVHDLIAGTLVVKKDAPLRLGMDTQQIVVGGLGGSI